MSSSAAGHLQQTLRRMRYMKTNAEKRPGGNTEHPPQVSPPTAHRNGQWVHGDRADDTRGPVAQRRAILLGCVAGNDAEAEGTKDHYTLDFAGVMIIVVCES